MLVSQRVLRAYQAKRQKLRNDKTRTKDDISLKSEHLGYRRFTLYGLQLESKFAEFNEAQIKSGRLTGNWTQILKKRDILYFCFVFV